MIYRSEFVPPHDVGETSTTDQQGNVLVAVSTHFDLVELFILDPAGVLLSHPPEATGASSFGRAAIGVAEGFIGVQNIDSASFGEFPSHRVLKLFPDGGTKQTAFDTGLGSQGEDPRGGMVVLVSETKTLTAYDQDLEPRWETQLPITDWNPVSNALRLPVGVDTGRNSLVLFPHDPSAPGAGVMGIWTDSQGHPGAVFDTGQSGPPSCLRFTTSLTGGLYLQNLGCAPHQDTPGKFVSSFQPLDQDPGPVPEWLGQRPGIELRPIRGGAGYAAIGGPAGPGACLIEVLTPDGHSCGHVDFERSVAGSAFRRGSNAGPSSRIFCDLSVGPDGTVIARTEEVEPTQGLLRFNWHWWPAFFR
ncbi:MAG: hypothetical protein EHM78_22265 [Myxococcaceae bacterium]|nr:MAG: hypothetical protein EHM78_22265 [Myxococcaceae bacterium]